MATPLQKLGRAERKTPSSRHTAANRTPQCALLTPNDDKAERASVKRQKRSEAQRKSLSDAFAASADQQHGHKKGILSKEALAILFDNCVKLAAENKITDKNVWQLPLIDHLDSIIATGTLNSASGFNFQKISGGLDAGVTIYSKRVDTTYKEAFQSLQGLGPSSKDVDDDDDGHEGYAEDDIEDAAAAAKQAKQDAAPKRKKQGAANEEATLATADQLKQKKVDTTFAVDPMFHKMSALFDEGGAKGLLLLNRSVYKGVSIMTDPHDIPEQQFPVATAAAEPDTLINLQPLRQQLAACHAASSSADLSVFTPEMGQLYGLLEKAVKKVPGRQKQQQRASMDVAAVMAQAIRGLSATPMPTRSCNNSTGAATPRPTSAVGTAAEESPMHCDGDQDTATAAGPEAASNADMGCAAESQAVAAFLAEAAAAGPDDDAAAADGNWGEEGTYADEGHAGYEDDGEGLGASAVAWEPPQQRRQSLMGLDGNQADHDAADVLDADALQQLLSGGTGKVGTTAGSGWAGSSFWKYKSAAAAIARLGGAATTAAKKATAAGSGRSRSGPFRIDFENIPELPEGALAHGTRKQTCLVTAATTQPTLLPEDLHYQASSLWQLSLRPAPIQLARQQGGSRAPTSDAAGDVLGDAATGDWRDDGDDGWGGDGYSDDAGDGGDGYNAGDLSMGDPGYSAAGVAADEEDSAGWWDRDNELLSAPKRTAGLGVNYNRSAKQVDVRALKDLLWDSLITVNEQAATTSSSMDTDSAGAAAGAPVIPFQDVIVSVPEESAAGSLEDVSVHMCFICLLHLANEKGLVIKAKEDLRTLTISNVHA